MRQQSISEVQGHMGIPQKAKREALIDHNDMTNSSMQEDEQSSHKEADANLNINEEHATITRLDTATYIHDMAIELKSLAETANFSFLGYLLELAIEESAAQKRGCL